MEQHFIPPEDSRVKEQETTDVLTPGYQQTADPNLVAHQLDPNPVLQHLWHSLHNDVWDEIKQKFEDGKEYDLEPTINIAGINAIINKIRLRFNHFTSLSNLTEESIVAMKEECEHDINELLFEKDEIFELDPAFKSGIINDVGQCVFIGLNRAKNQGERVFLSKTMETKQIFQEREKQKKGLKAFLPW